MLLNFDWELLRSFMVAPLPTRPNEAAQEYGDRESLLYSSDLSWSALRTAHGSATRSVQYMSIDTTRSRCSV
jgi:hypothetical protein